MIEMHSYSLNINPPRPLRTGWPLWVCLLAGGAYLALAGFMAYLAVAWRGLAGLPVR